MSPMTQRLTIVKPAAERDTASAGTLVLIGVIVWLAS